jgi:hypothetical protein
MSTFICRTLTNVLLQVGAERGCLDLGDRATPTSGAFGKMRETGGAHCMCLASWAPGDQKRHGPPVALVSGAIGCLQPVLLVQ